MRTYVDRTWVLGRSPPGRTCQEAAPLRWLVEATALASSSQGWRPPEGLRAHPTRSLAPSWALFRGVDLQEICAAARWSSPLTFVRFYMLDVSAPSVPRAVLLPWLGLVPAGWLVDAG